MATFYKGDCLFQMKKLKSKSINLIYWNPPFGTTANFWDEKLDWVSIFKECFRILTDDGMLVMHCSIPFNYTLIRASPHPPSYTWYWDKVNTTLPTLAKKQPLRHVEEVLVWKNKKPTYNPQRVGTELRMVHADGKSSYMTGDFANRRLEKREVIGRYQTHLITMKRKIDGFSTRPSELIKLFINSYTKEGDTILDPTCYKGLTGTIAKSMNRKWIGIDKYFFPELLIKSK
jgi:DNA modification methylase